MDNPYDDRESLLDAINVFLQLPKPLIFHLYPMQYFPGYPFTKKAVKDGHVREEDIGIDTLFERNQRNWGYVPKVLPFNQKQMLQNLMWLIVNGYVSDGAAKAASSGLAYPGFLLNYLNLKAVILGKLMGAGVHYQTFIGMSFKGETIVRFKILIDHIIKGEFSRLFSRITALMAKMRKRSGAGR
jgi:hypothetical protein